MSLGCYRNREIKQKHSCNAKFNLHSRQQVQTLHHTRILCNQNRKSNSRKHKHNKLFAINYSRFKNIKIVSHCRIFYFMIIVSQKKPASAQTQNIHILYVQAHSLHFIDTEISHNVAVTVQVNIPHNWPYNTTTTQNKQRYAVRVKPMTFCSVIW